MRQNRKHKNENEKWVTHTHTFEYKNVNFLVEQHTMKDSAHPNIVRNNGTYLFFYQLQLWRVHAIRHQPVWKQTNKFRLCKFYKTHSFRCFCEWETQKICIFKPSKAGRVNCAFPKFSRSVICHFENRTKEEGKMNEAWILNVFSTIVFSSLFVAISLLTCSKVGLLLFATSGNPRFRRKIRKIPPLLHPLLRSLTPLQPHP